MTSRYIAILGTLAIGVIFATPMIASAGLLYDVNNGATTTTNTLSGWIAATPTNGVTFAAVGGATIGFRDRGVGNTDGTGADSANNDMWRDFIFVSGSDATGTKGLDITITGLLFSTNYNVRVWAWDDSTSTNPVATWNGNSLTFPNTPDPASLNDYVVSFTATTDNLGTLVLQGRGVNAATNNVFINGFELTAVPEPGSLALLGLGLMMTIGFIRLKRGWHGLLPQAVSRSDQRPL